MVTAARGGAGTDVLVLDGNGDTSLGLGDSWTNASGDLDGDGDRRSQPVAQPCRWTTRPGCRPDVGEAGDSRHARGRQDAEGQARPLVAGHAFHLHLVRGTEGRQARVRGPADADQGAEGSPDHGEGDRDQDRLPHGLEIVGQNDQGDVTHACVRRASRAADPADP